MTDPDTPTDATRNVAPGREAAVPVTDRLPIRTVPVGAGAEPEADKLPMRTVADRFVTATFAIRRVATGQAAVADSSTSRAFQLPIVAHSAAVIVSAISPPVGVSPVHVFRAVDPS